MIISVLDAMNDMLVQCIKIIPSKIIGGGGDKN